MLHFKISRIFPCCQGKVCRLQKKISYKCQIGAVSVPNWTKVAFLHAGYTLSEQQGKQ